MNRLRIHGFAVLASLLIPTAVLAETGAESADVQPHRLVVPKPARPRLRLPEMRSPRMQSPDLEIEPLRMRPAQPRPKLNSLPNLRDETENDDEGSEESD